MLYDCIVIKVDYPINDFHCSWYLIIVNENIFCPRDNYPYENSYELEQRCVNFILNEAKEQKLNDSFSKHEYINLQETIVDMANKIFYGYTNLDHFLCVGYPEYRESFILNHLYLYFVTNIKRDDVIRSHGMESHTMTKLIEFNEIKRNLIKCYNKENYIIACKNNFCERNDLNKQDKNNAVFHYGMEVISLYNDYKVELPRIKDYCLLFSKFFVTLHKETIIRASTKDLTYKFSFFPSNAMISRDYNRIFKNLKKSLSN
ncbi:hypothetical protein COBT_000809 [Conglomerata obtusa]